MSISVQVHRFELIIETSLAALPDACFEGLDVDPEESRHSSLADFLEIFTRLPYDHSKNIVLEFARRLSRLISVLPCCVHNTLHVSSCATTLSITRCYFGRNEKLGVKHVDGDVTGAGAIGAGRQCCTHRARHLAARVQVSLQPL